MNSKILLLNQSYAFATNYEGSYGTGKLFLKFVFYLVAFLFILILAFYGTKLFAKRTKNLLRSKYIEIIDTISLDRNAKLIIAKISSNIYILSVTNNNVNVVDKIDEEEFDLKENIEFEDYLNNFRNSSFNNQFGNMKLKIKRLLSKFYNKFNSKNEEDREDEKDI